jgi:hypothetical protein
MRRDKYKMCVLILTASAVGTLALSLASRGIGAKVEARNEYQSSAADYKAWLAANPATPQSCEGPRLAMASDGENITIFPQA